MNSIKIKVGAWLLALCTAIGFGVFAAPAAQANSLDLCMKNVTTSDFYFTVQFQNQGTYTGTFNDAINLGEVSGECGSTNVFSEPTQFRVPPGAHGRVRARWASPNCGGTWTVGAWSGYYNAPPNYYPNGRWVHYDIPPTSTGQCIIWETEEKNGLT